MKIASFKAGSVASYGIVTGGGVIDAGRRLKDFATKALLTKGSLDALKALRNERADFALDDIELLPTVPEDGDVVEVEISGIGVLRNPVRNEAAAAATRAA